MQCMQGYTQRKDPIIDNNVLPITYTSSGAGPAPCILALVALETDHLEKLQARPSVLTQRREQSQQS